jgi:hypothetical protein
MIRCMSSRPNGPASVFADIFDKDGSDDEEEADTASKPQKRKKAEGILAEIIRINVGNVEDIVTTPVHRSFLCSKSKYFKAAGKEDQLKSSFGFPNEEPEIFERIMNWIHGKGFLLPKDQDKEDDAEWLFTSAFAGIQSDDEPELSEKRINLDTGYDISDNEQEAQSPTPTACKIDAPTLPDTLTLSKIYAVAEFLEMHKLCNEIIKLLGKRLGHDMKTPGQALTYVFSRCNINSPLRKLLVDFTARSAPIFDVLQDPTSDATSELWRALVEELTRVRGADVLHREGLDAALRVYAWRVSPLRAVASMKSRETGNWI